MTILKPLTLTWWQTGLFKLGLLALGVLVGACWPAAFAALIPALAAIAVATLAYITWIWIKA